MEVHSNGHHHTKRSTHKMPRKATHVAKKAERSATQLVHKGERALEKTQAYSFIRKNPKSAVGIALGAGLVVGAVANGKFARALAIGLAGYLGKRFF